MLRTAVVPDHRRPDRSTQEANTMRNRIATLAAMAALALALGASPVMAGSPAEHYRMIPIDGLVFACGATTITTTSGTIEEVTRTATDAAGNWMQTGTGTLRAVGAVDAGGHAYSVVGTTHWGLRYNEQTGVIVGVVDGYDVSGAITTFKFQFLSQGGGRVGSLNFIQRVSPNGNYQFLSPGDCMFS
jgi:hypothetical protein